MRKPVLEMIFVLCLACALQPSISGQGTMPTAIPQSDCMPLGRAYTRTTLYFGLNEPKGTVSERQWQAFLRDQVTPRFPNGLTVWNARGQWKGQDGRITREPAKVVQLHHQPSPEADASIRAIITAYKGQFQQESVLWETSPVCAAF